MEYRKLGSTGLEVSALSLGTMAFGSDNVDAERIYGTCRSYGVNFFDCANVYNSGEAERILGKLISSERQHVLVATKSYFPTGQGPNERGSSRLHLVNSLHDSLRRLNTDYVDLFYLHRFDPTCAPEETLRTLSNMVSSGKVRYLGASNFAAWQLAKHLKISAAFGLYQFSAIQPMYNLLKRQAEVEILPQAADEKLGVISYSPLAGGLLSGKYFQGKKGRITDNPMYSKRYKNPRYWEETERFIDFTSSNNLDPVAVAHAWVLSNSIITSALVGAKQEDHVHTAMRAFDLNLSQDTLRAITSLSETPSPSTDRHEENSDSSYDKILTKR